jgi:hypothetical protein
MRSRVVWVAVIGLMAVSASSLAQQTPLSDPNSFVTENCSGDRGFVRTGRVFGSPAAIAGARPITLLAFSKLAFRNAADSTKWPSKVAPTSLTTGEGILYRIDNLELRGQDNCLDSIVVQFGDFGGFNTPPEIEGLLPSSACTVGAVKDTVEAAKTVFTDQLSIWGADTWHNTFEKGCGGGGDGKSQQRVSVVGYGFWDDTGGTVAPVMRLSPILAIIDTSDGVSDGGTGGNGGNGGTPTPPVTGLTVVLPDDVRATPVTIGNSSATTVLFSTFAASTSTADVSVSATSDADDLLVSVNHPVVAAPGSGDEILTIQTTATTTAGNHFITITAANDTDTASATVFVTVLCDPPFILGIDQPKGSTIGLGRPALLSVKASGSGPLTYQWFTGASGLSNFPLPGGTSANFTTSALNDTTSYWVRVSNPCGSVNSQTATVNVSAGAKPAGRR